VRETDALMKTVALYRDYKDLYMKVVPVVDMVTERMNIINKEHQQNKEIIAKLDSNLLLCA
jgi:hypothetical protein